MLFPVESTDEAPARVSQSGGEPGEGETPAARSCPSPVAAAPGRPLALLIDDDPFVRLVFSRMAPLIGLDLVAAETGEDAVRMFQPRAAEFSVIILDLTLPGMSGWECHDLLRAVRPDIPVVISSGLAADSSAREFAGRRVAGVLPKPFTIESLQQTLEALGLRIGVR